MPENILFYQISGSWKPNNIDLTLKWSCLVLQWKVWIQEWISLLFKNKSIIFSFNLSNLYQSYSLSFGTFMFPKYILMYFHCQNLVQGCWMYKEISYHLKLSSQHLNVNDFYYCWPLCSNWIIYQIWSVNPNYQKKLNSSLVHGLSEVKINREISDLTF